MARKVALSLKKPIFKMLNLSQILPLDYDLKWHFLAIFIFMNRFMKYRQLLYYVRVTLVLAYLSKCYTRSTSDIIVNHIRAIY